MKRTALKRTGFLSRSRPMRAVNPANRKKRQARKPRLRASVRKAVLERDGHQCTYLYMGGGFGQCDETERLEVHHEHYRGGDDLTPLKTLCRYHHHLIESQLRPWNVNRLGR